MVILSSAISSEQDVTALQMKPAFRKASKKMMMAFVALERALASSGLKEFSSCGLVLNTGFGEIEATGGFLKAFEETRVARPLLFQNSLHNSTTGFLAIHFGIQGPVFTVNHRTEGGLEALEIASTLLEEGLCEHCFVVAVETVPPEFAVKDAGLEGAAALVVARDASEYILDQSVISRELEARPRIDLPLKGLQSLLGFDAIYRLAVAGAR